MSIVTRPPLPPTRNGPGQRVGPSANQTERTGPYVGHMTLAGRDHQWLAEAADTVAGQANTVAQQLFPSNCCCRGRWTTLFAVE